MYCTTLVKVIHLKRDNALSCIVQYGEVSMPMGYEIVRKDVDPLFRSMSK